MESYLFPSGIRFNECHFSEPVPVSHFTLPKCGGVFAILVSDPNWLPKPFQPLCFGEFGNNARSALPATDYASLSAAAHGRTLFVAALAMPFSTTSQRRATRDELISAYNPLCQSNRSGNVASLDHFVEHPAGPRRRIGFLPLPTPATAPQQSTGTGN
jgi:hypothetical protein